MNCVKSNEYELSSFFKASCSLALSGFTSMSKEVPPQVVMEFLNDLFSKFDELLEDYNVYKVG